MKVKRNVERAAEKYMLAVSFDISGAFVLTWWPEILRDLKE